MSGDRIEAASPAAYPIRIEWGGFRCHSDDDDFRLRVNADELAVDAERDQHTAIAVDAIPLAAIAGFRKYFGHFRTRPRIGIAALVDVVDPRARHDLLAVGDAATPDHLAEAGEVARRNADAAGGAH